MSKANENSKYLSKIWGKIIEKYPNKVIAIEDRKIIGVARNSRELIRKLEKEKKDLSSILIVSIPPRNVAYIL